MFKKIILSLLLIASSLLADEISWAKDYKSGMQEASKQNKPVLFVFSRHTCKYCVMLDDTTFKDKQVIEALNRDFISIISYTDEDDYTPRGLLTPGTPAIWFLMPNEQPMFQPLMGAVDANNFLNALKIVKEEFDRAQTKGK